MDDLEQRLHEAACGTGDGDMADLLREAAAALEAAREDNELLAEALLELCNVIDGHEVPVAVEGKAAHARAALEAARDGMTSPVTPTATPPVRILIGAIESEILQLEGKATWMSQAARIASLRAAIDAAREPRNG